MMAPATPAVTPLLAALHAEADGLDAFAACADAQLAALGARTPERLEHAAQATMDAVVALDEARRRRADEAVRAARAAGLAPDAPLRALADAVAPDVAAPVLAARTRVLDRARHADARADALQGAMRYAASLGRDILDAWHALDVPRPARVYTAAGAAATASPSSLRLDQTG